MIEMSKPTRRGAAAIGRREVFCGLGAMGAVPALASCGRASDGLTVILDWLFNVNHAALFAAQHTGAFARRGLKVNLVAPSDPDSPARLVAAGQSDMALSYGTQINMLVDKGLPLVRVGTLIDRPMNSVVALGDGGIRAIPDLKGRNIGVSVGGVEEVMVDAMLRSGGVSPSEVSIVRVSYQMVTALLGRKIDAAIGAFRNAEVLELESAGAKPVVFAPEDHGVPVYDELILVARRDRQSDPRLKRFLDATREGVQALRGHSAELLRAYGAAHPEQDAKILAKAWPITLAAVPDDPAKLDRDRYLNFQKFCLEQRIISKTAPLDQFAVELH